MQIDIVKYNKLIAFFMGAKTKLASDLKDGEIWLPIYGICKADTIKVGNGKTLHYHDSWDWLMRVVEKIEQLKNKENRFIVNEFTIDFDSSEPLNSYQVTISSVFKPEFGGFPLIKVKAFTKREAVYNACIEFIEWYNEQNL